LPLSVKAKDCLPGCGWQASRLAFAQKGQGQTGFFLYTGRVLLKKKSKQLLSTNKLKTNRISNLLFIALLKKQAAGNLFTFLLRFSFLKGLMTTSKTKKQFYKK